MKKIIGVILVLSLLMSVAVPAVAATKANTYSLPLEGTVLQDQADRKIQNKTPAERNPIIPGESPTTGLEWSGVYLPMLVQISNPQGSVKYNGTTIKSAGVGNRAPWGG